MNKEQLLDLGLLAYGVWIFISGLLMTWWCYNVSRRVRRFDEFERGQYLVIETLKDLTQIHIDINEHNVHESRKTERCYEKIEEVQKYLGDLVRQFNDESGRFHLAESKAVEARDRDLRSMIVGMILKLKQIVPASGIVPPTIPSTDSGFVSPPV